MEFTLKNHTPVKIRRVRPEDDGRLIQVFDRCSPETIYQRFLTGLRELTPEMARHLANVDHCRRLALIAENASGPIGVARYEPSDDPGEAELAIVVVDEWQDLGLGRILLRNVLRAAKRNGIRRFRAYLLAENSRILRLLATETRIEEWSVTAGMATLSLTHRH